MAGAPDGRALAATFSPETQRSLGAAMEVAMRTAMSRLAAVVLAGAVAVPVSASAVGDATYSLASYRAMSTPTASPYDRIMAVYTASAERFEMLERLREKYPTLLW
jgi:hypothetical protein